jgi:hypothetical protein
MQERGDFGMIQVSILTRRLKEGKTYEDFRKAWYHTIGFGGSLTEGRNRMYTVINGYDPREIIVIGISDIGDVENLVDVLKTDVRERLLHPLEDVIEPEIVRKFGALVSVDDFGGSGTLEYTPPAIDGKETGLEQVARDLKRSVEIIDNASRERDRLRGTQLK